MIYRNLTIAHAKRDFALGHVKSFHIERSLMSDSWCVVIHGINSYGFLIDARTLQVRDFKSLDSVVVTLTAIGFNVVKLIMGVKK